MIPFNKPVFLGTELAALRTAIETNGHLAGGGPFGKRCEEQLTRRIGRRTLLVTSCTHALELTGLLLDLKPGDEFIVPSFTFVSTANAFVLRGAKPVFADCDRFGNITAEEVARLMTPRTRAVVVVHYAGNACDLKGIAAAAGAVPLIEDAAQALGSAVDGRPLGSHGVMAAFSFHETKNVGSGEGGALTLRDETFLERAEYIREKGTNRRRFQDGLVDKYTWVDVGSSFVLSDLNAAYLSVQLDAFEQIQARRHAIFARYQQELGSEIEGAGGYFITHRAGVTPNAHLFGIVLRSRDDRGRFIAALKEHQIMAPFHYVALHGSPMGARFHDGRPLPQSTRLSDCLVRLPLFYNLTDGEQGEVIARAREALARL